MWTDQPDFFMNNHDKKKHVKKEKRMDIEEILRQELDNLMKQKTDLQKQLAEIDEKVNRLSIFFRKKGKGLK
jgi:DNA-directed RNA polymerase alpha subunit